MDQFYKEIQQTMKVNVEEICRQDKGQNPKLKDMMNEMDILMLEMQERMSLVMQRQKDNISLAFKIVLQKKMDELKELKELLIKQEKKMKESQNTDQKLHYFRNECHSLNDMIIKFQKENKELKGKILDSGLALNCNEQALISQGKQIFDLKKRSQSLQQDKDSCSIEMIDKAQVQEKTYKSQTKSKKGSYNRDKAYQKLKSQPFHVDEEQKTQINAYILDQVAGEATEQILKKINEPNLIKLIIKQLLLDNVMAIKEQTVRTYMQYIAQLKNDMREEAELLKIEEQQRFTLEEKELRDIFQDAIKSVGVFNSNRQLPKNKQNKADLIVHLLQDSRFLRMLEHKIFALKCCQNKNCLYNSQNYKLFNEHSFQSTINNPINNSKVSQSASLSPILSNYDFKQQQDISMETSIIQVPSQNSKLWQQYGRHNFDNLLKQQNKTTTRNETLSKDDELRKLRREYQINYNQLRTLGNPQMIRGLSKAEQLKKQSAIQEAQTTIKNVLLKINRYQSLSLSQRH